jgi:hypothetical protein
MQVLNDSMLEPMHPNEVLSLSPAVKPKLSAVKVDTTTGIPNDKASLTCF